MRRRLVGRLTPNDYERRNAFAEHLAEVANLQCHTLKFVILGDEGVGKSSFVQSILRGGPPGETVPKCISPELQSFELGNSSFSIGWWDTTDATPDALLSSANLYVYAFSVIEPTSLESIQTEHARKVNDRAGRSFVKTPTFLLGLRHDETEDHVPALQHRGLTPVEISTAEDVASQIGCQGFWLHSSHTASGESVDKLVQKFVSAALMPDDYLRTGTQRHGFLRRLMKRLFDSERQRISAGRTRSLSHALEGSPGLAEQQWKRRLAPMDHPEQEQEQGDPLRTPPEPPRLEVEAQVESSPRLDHLRTLQFSLPLLPTPPQQIDFTLINQRLEASLSSRVSRVLFPEEEEVEELCNIEEEEEKECGECFEVFEVQIDGRRRRKLVPCGHEMCDTCLIRMMEEVEAYRDRCPFCTLKFTDVVES